MNRFTLIAVPMLFALFMSASTFSDSMTGGLVELWERHDALVGTVEELDVELKTSQGELILTSSLLNTTRTELETTKTELAEAKASLEIARTDILSTHSELEATTALLISTSADLVKVESSVLWDQVAIFGSLRREMYALITDPMLYRASSLRQGELVDISPQVIMGILSDAASIWESLESNEIIKYLSLDEEWHQASISFRSLLAEIQERIDSGEHIDGFEDYMKSLDGLNPHGNIMEVLFLVFRESIEATNEDKQYFLAKLGMMRQMSNAMAEYLNTLGEVNSLITEAVVTQWLSYEDPPG